jgi:hypothetical protein
MRGRRSRLICPEVAAFLCVVALTFEFADLLAAGFLAATRARPPAALGRARPEALFLFDFFCDDVFGVFRLVRVPEGASLFGVRVTVFVCLAAAFPLAGALRAVEERRPVVFLATVFLATVFLPTVFFTGFPGGLFVGAAPPPVPRTRLSREDIFLGFLAIHITPGY